MNTWAILIRETIQNTHNRSGEQDIALLETISDTIKETRINRIDSQKQEHYEAINFANIRSVKFEGTKTVYAIETQEKYDPVATGFLTHQDGWQHYETQIVEYTVEKGENYCFTIQYNNGTEIYREFHETSPLTARLLTYCNKSKH